MKKPPHLPTPKRPATPKRLATEHKSRKPAPAPATPKAARSDSHIADHSYSPETGHLTVTFSGGRQYRYDGVDQKTMDRAENTTSMGSFLHSHIIGKFDATKL